MSCKSTFLGSLTFMPKDHLAHSPSSSKHDVKSAGCLWLDSLIHISCILLLLMDSSYRAQFCCCCGGGGGGGFQPKPQCASTHHSRTYMHVTYTSSIVTGMVCPRFYKGLSEQESPGVCFPPRQIGEISQTGRQRIPDRWSDKTDKRSPKDFTLRYLMLPTTPLTPYRYYNVNHNTPHSLTLL